MGVRIGKKYFQLHVMDSCQPYTLLASALDKPQLSTPCYGFKRMFSVGRGVWHALGTFNSMLWIHAGVLPPKPFGYDHLSTPCYGFINRKDHIEHYIPDLPFNSMLWIHIYKYYNAIDSAVRELSTPCYGFDVKGVTEA